MPDAFASAVRKRTAQLSSSSSSTTVTATDAAKQNTNNNNSRKSSSDESCTNLKSSCYSLTKFSLICYLLMLGMLLIFQKQLVFIGSTMKNSSHTNMDMDKLPHNLAGRVRAFNLHRSNGESFRVVMSNNMDAPSLKGVAVFWGGNGETYAALLHRCVRFQEFDLLVFANEYPGYSYHSPGDLNQFEIIDAAKVMTEHARDVAQRLNLPLVLIGSSLGTFSAARMFGLGYGAKLLMHAPLTSMLNVAKELYWYVPVERFLHREVRFDMTEDFPLIAQRVMQEGNDIEILIVHGDLDQIVPFHSGRSVFEAISAPAGAASTQGTTDSVERRGQVSFVTSLMHGHNNVDLRKTGKHGSLLTRFLCGKKK